MQVTEEVVAASRLSSDSQPPVSGQQTQTKSEAGTGEARTGAPSAEEKKTLGAMETKTATGISREREICESERRELVIGYVPFVREYLNRHHIGLTPASYYTKTSDNAMELLILRSLHAENPTLHGPHPETLPEMMREKDGDALLYWTKMGSIVDLAGVLDAALSAKPESGGAHFVNCRAYLYDTLRIIVAICRNRLRVHLKLDDHPTPDYSDEQYLMCTF